jgi:hypothetical protein
VFDALYKIVDMNSWDPVLSSANNRERGEVWMETQPSTSVKLIENVI